MNKLLADLYDESEGHTSLQRSKNVDVPLMNEKWTGHVSLMTKED